MIRVCDAIMSSGKSSSCINYMNEHPDQRYIYITPYLDEAKRIKYGCPHLHFVEPKERYEKEEMEAIDTREDDEVLTERKIRKITKVMNTAELIMQGKNIATTHQAFLYYTEDMLEQIRRLGYTLFIDEDVNVITKYESYRLDLEMLVAGGFITLKDDKYILLRDSDGPTRLCGILRTLKSRDLERISVRSDKIDTVFWVMPPRLLSAFKDVFILTYLFEGQAIHNLLRVNGLPYEKIGIRRDEAGYHFDPAGHYIPEYVAHLKDLIQIEDNEKLNEIGDERTALSASWFKKTKNKAKIERLRSHIDSYFRYRNDEPASQRMWTTFKCAKSSLTTKGAKKRWLPFNKKATNDYADRTIMVYAANIFMSPAFKTYYKRNGVEVNEDLYALSALVQWIFRSGIRNGHPIKVYIPSKRMRNLLLNWLNSLINESTALQAEEERGAA